MPKLTTKERIFLDETNRILKQVNNLDDKAVREMVEFLRNTQRSIIAMLSELSPEEYKFNNLTAINQSIEQVIGEFKSNYGNLMNARLEDAFELGVNFVDKPIIKAGIGLGEPMLSRELVEISQLMSADLVTDISEKMRQTINANMRLGILGEKSPGDLINELSRDKNFKRGRFKSVKDRAELITRQEINRTLSLATIQREGVWAEVVPGLSKYWLTAGDELVRQTHKGVGARTNPASGGTPIPIKAKFNVGGFKARGPHDASLPAKEVMNCRCRSVRIFVEPK